MLITWPLNTSLITAGGALAAHGGLASRRELLEAYWNAGGMGHLFWYGAAAALGVATIMGVILTDTLVPLQTYGLGISAGVTIYVGASNLVPELQSRGGWGTPLSFVAGSGAFFGMRLLF